MSAADLTTGFFGKIPTTGDFVSRGLPADFIRHWDRWVARHLAPLLASGSWDEDIGLRFLLGPDAGGPMAGVALPSADRAGRRFPLTVASQLSSAATGLATGADRWFNDVQELAGAAQRGKLTPDALEAELLLLTFPTVGEEGEIVRGMVFWTTPHELRDVDPEVPLPAMRLLLAARHG